MRATTAALPELWHFTFSMYPEKARWALDYKRIPHRRRTLLPGPHALQLLPRFGQKSMPVLRDGDVLTRDSAGVIDHLERRYPQPPLYPDDPAERRRALEMQRWLDRDVGPQVRRAAFHELLPHARYMADLWSAELAPAGRKLYAALFPLLVRPVMKLDMQVTARGAERGLASTREALDFVARESAATGYLVGQRFTVADLTAASVLFLTDFCPQYPLALPKPYPAGLQSWLSRWSGHPGTAYVRRMYRQHRGVSSSVKP